MKTIKEMLVHIIYRYYAVLSYITKGKKSIVSKKLLYGAILIGVSSQMSCKQKTIESKDKDGKKDSIQINKTNIDKIHDSDRVMCYETGKITTNDKNIGSNNVSKKDKKDNSSVLFNKPIIDESYTQVSCYDVSIKTEPDTIGSYTVVEQMPEFPGGDDALKAFLVREIKYPPNARNMSVTGTVYVSFIVLDNGIISDVKVLRGIGSGCDEEAVRVVKLMPNWKPGEQEGKKVDVKYNLPIKFKLD